MGKGPEQTLLQGGRTEGSETYERVLSITSHQRDANEIHNEIPIHSSRNGHQGKTMVHLHNGLLLSRKKEGAPTLWDCIDGSGEHYAKWKKPSSERKTLYDLNYKWNLINKTNKQTKYNQRHWNKEQTDSNQRSGGGPSRNMYKGHMDKAKEGRFEGGRQWCEHRPTVSTVLWVRLDKFTWTTEILWTKRDNTAALSVKERAGLSLAWTGFYWV